MTTLRLGWVIVGWLITAGLVQAAMYKWVDDNGVTQYSQFPPPNRDAKIVVPPPPPAEDAAGAQKRLEETLQKRDENRKAQAEAQAEQEKAAEVATQQQKNCAMARDNLEKLTSRGRMRVIGADGVTTYLTEEERQARIAESKQHIEEYCE